MKKINDLLIALGILSLLLLLVAGPLYRFEVLELGTAFLLLRWAAYIGIGAGVLLIVWLVWQRPKGTRATLSIIALITAAVAVWMPYSQLQQARSVPPIHDITTDTENPPEFVAIASLRADAPNPVEYAGPETAEQQLKAYPDLETYRTDLATEELYDKALAAVKDMGWELVAGDRDEGRIEATDTTTWFGFKDDVVIRIRVQAGETQLDIRSKSRVGRSDVGKNADRIREFLARLDK
ncbi:DUF1499 domain-containing protein [Pseudidiomarina gelatinasegens]|uniref:DUF1499 domain-containing protein n=1 Tax=Pseudidiomarina gelatinasegens TaxID=2487740 RepID=A0A443YZD4_9GAMM|nr:DUF1499 domain-containing protein [Pseudidiomarina gelatinasegens]RWU09580.1 DUF1499 domain-containing protein [Pseudidiomarina gelatinasegens]